MTEVSRLLLFAFIFFAMPARAGNRKELGMNDKIINALASDLRAALARCQASRKLLNEGNINYRAYEKTVSEVLKATNAYAVAATKQGV